MPYEPLTTGVLGELFSQKWLAFFVDYGVERICVDGDRVLIGIMCIMFSGWIFYLKADFFAPMTANELYCSQSVEN